MNKNASRKIIISQTSPFKMHEILPKLHFSQITVIIEDD